MHRMEAYRDQQDESNRPTPSVDQASNPEKDTAKSATKKSGIPVKKQSSSSKLSARDGKDDGFVQSELDEKAIQISSTKSDSQNSTRVESKGKSKRISAVSSAASSEKGVSRTSSANDLETGSWNNIKVVVRVRPLNASELHREEKASIEYPEKGVIWVNAQSNTKPFTFNSIFEEKVSQAQIFEQCGIKELLEQALDGFSCTAFAFGQTGSGKTYTITGPFNPDASDILPTQSLFGLLPRSFEHLLSEVEKREENYIVKASYLEVYNEKVKDLLNPSRARDSLPVRWSTSNGFYVENIFMMECQTVADLMAVLEEGLQNRQVGAHAMNDYSSRSHTMLTVYLDSELNDPEDALPVMKHGKISFVDLAGSERVKETKSTGGTLTESQNINKSLLTLGNCIAALGDPKKRGGHIPYRESKLTMLLADSIGGEGYTLMIACISPSSSAMQDTLNTLRYANRAKNIKNKPVVKMDPREQLIISMKREMKLLKAENAYFRQQLNIPCSDAQMVITPSQIQGVMSADENSGMLSPAIGTDTLSSLHSSSRNSLAEVKSEESVPRTTTAMYAMTASIGLYDMLQEYINENESLRQQNTELFKGRKEVEKDYEMLSMKNESLIQKLGNIERALSSTSLSTRSDSDETITGNGNVRRRSLVEFRGEAPFNLSFPPLRSGTYPNIVSTDVDLSLEFEMERNKLKEERERKKKEDLQNEESKEAMTNQSIETMKKPDINQNWVGVKAEEAKAVSNPKSKNQDQTTVSAKNANDKTDQGAAKPVKPHFKFKSPKRKTLTEREKSMNSYAAKFAVRKGLTSQHQQQAKEPGIHDTNNEQWNPAAESNIFQGQLSDPGQSHVGHIASLDLNNAHLMNDQLRKELDHLEGQIQKEFAFKQTKKPKYHGR